ncbi:MAG: hypothetical protein H6741_22955 [Alphaproteobacteria bacterium]|nr:hypothetical protein [Alphaproteobacteria bacterium]
MTNAKYFPRALLTYEPGGDLREEDLFLHALEKHAAISHETVHWLQHHGTGVGAFQSAIQLSQELTLLNLLRSLEESERDRLINRRFREKEPLLLFDTSERPLFRKDAPIGDPESVAYQIWYDHQWVYAAFDDPDQIARCGIIPTSAISEVFADVLMFLSECLGIGVYPGHKRARDLLQFGEGIRFCTINNSSHLSTRLIMECAALLEELRLLESPFWTSLDQMDAQKFEERLFHTLQTGAYGAPFRVLSHSLSEQDSLSSILMTTKIVCFAALDSPLPPLVVNVDGPILWDDVYPPVRFSRLVDAVAHIGALRGDADSSEIKEYIRKLMSVSGLNWCETKLDENFARRSGRFEFTDITFTETMGKTCTYHDYVAWVQEKLFRMRDDDLLFITSYADCLSGSNAGKYIDILIGDTGIPFGYCPLRAGDEGKIMYAHNASFGQWLVGSVAMHYATYDVVVGHGALDLSIFPEDVSQSDILHQIIENSIRMNATHPTLLSEYRQE